MDLFAGACTSLEAAAGDGRRFVGADQCPLTVNIARRRLADVKTVYHLGPSPETGALCRAEVVGGVGLYHVTLAEFQLETPCLNRNGFEAVDNWPRGICATACSGRPAISNAPRRSPCCGWS